MLQIWEDLHNLAYLMMIADFMIFLEQELTHEPDIQKLHRC